MIAKYGLPEKVLFCRRCVMSNQRPNSVREFDHVATSKKETIHFDAEGVCDACRVAESKALTDWRERERELLDLCDRHRSRTGAWDCLVPGSGGKDSFYAAHILKTRFGMHPLTCTWAPHIYTDWGFRNHQRWIGSGFTNLLYFPDPRVHRLITRLAVERLFHPFQPFIIGQKAMAPKLAALHGIPLVFYGENEAEYGNARATHSTAVRADSFHAQTGTQLYLGGVSTDELRSKHGLSSADLAPYEPASAAVRAAPRNQTCLIGPSGCAKR
jgi:N-acetyl sugar amidotransferase